VVNTCGFIRPAVEESLRTILDLAASRPKRGRRPVLAVTGCLVSRYAKDLMAGMPEVDLWLSTHELDLWPQRAAAALKRAGFAGAGRRRLSTAPGHAYLKISEGCSHDCRFCTIPSIRGPHRSRPLESLLAEARELLSQCVPELVGWWCQDVTAYGRDLAWKKRPAPTPGGPAAAQEPEWLRLMYLYWPG
jgi:tRNA A37 methylthiotransferase MiaB